MGAGKLAKLWQFFRQKNAAGAVMALVIGLAITVAAARLWPDVVSVLASLLGLSELSFYVLLLAIALVALAAYLGFYWNEIFQRGQGLSDLVQRPERLRAIPITTELQLREIQEGVVAEVFGSYTPPNEEVYRTFRKNSRRSIGLFSSDLGAFVGFASIWPITREAAEAIKAGERVEEELTEDDILGVDHNQRAEFAVILGIAVLPNRFGTTSERGRHLIRAFRGFIADEYLAAPGRSLELLASAFSNDGLEMCNKFKMTPLGNFIHRRRGRLGVFKKGRPMPLFSRKVTLADLKPARRRSS